LARTPAWAPRTKGRKGVTGSFQLREGGHFLYSGCFPVQPWNTSKNRQTKKRLIRNGQSFRATNIMDRLNEEICVPKEIGICIDGFGFLGLLDLRTRREKYGPKEFLGLVKDRASAAYLVDYNNNENTRGHEFLLRKTETTHPAGVYHVTDSDRPDGIDELSKYVIYIDDVTYCYFETVGSGSRLPEVRTGRKEWKSHYEVVKAQE
jgi:hypothetical protein